MVWLLVVLQRMETEVGGGAAAAIPSIKLSSWSCRLLHAGQDLDPLSSRRGDGEVRRFLDLAAGVVGLRQGSFEASLWRASAVAQSWRHPR